MKKTSDSGIQTERTEDAARSVGEMFFCRCIPAALGFVSAAYAAAASAGLSFSEMTAGLIVGLVFCLLPLLEKTRASKFKTVIPLTALLVFTLCFKSRLTDGACAVYNGWRYTRMCATGIFAQALDTGASAETLTVSTAMFVAAACALLAALMTVLARLRFPAITILCTVLAAALAICLKDAFAPYGTAALLAAGALALVISAAPWGERRTLRASLGTAAVLAAACVALAASMSIPYLRSGRGFADSAAAIKNGIHRYKYEQTSPNLPEGDFDGLGGRESAGQEMLSVTMRDGVETMYLRGFTGDVYTGDGWAAASNDDLADNAEILYWLHRRGIYPQTQVAEAVRTVEDAIDMQAGQVTVKNTAACGKYVYIPYSVRRDGLEDVLTTEKLAPGAASQESTSRQARTYSYIKNAAEVIPEVIQNLNESDTPEVKSYLEAASVYGEFVKAHCLDVPEEVKTVLTEKLRDYVQEDMTYAQLVQCVRSFLDDNMSLENEPDVFTGDGDFALWTLEQGCGYDVHYATLTVLALRCLGIPARYAEGYVIDGETAQADENGVISVDDSCAHVWAELYQEGVGWIPVDLTPGFESTAGTIPQAGEQTVRASDREDPNSEIGTVPGEGNGASVNAGSEYNPDNDNDTGENDNNDDAPADAPISRTAVTIIVKNLPWLLLLIPIAAAVICIRRVCAAKRRKRLFEGENAAEAVSWMFAHAAAMLKTADIDRAHGSAYAMTEVVKERFGDEYAQGFEKMCALNGEAMFSGHIISEEKREKMRAFRDNTQTLVKKSTGVFKRIKYRWIKCAY